MFDFETIADALPVDTGSVYDPNFTVMAGAQMHFQTAPCVREALARRAEAGLYGYTSSDSPRYVAAVCGWMRDRRGWTVAPDWLVPTYGILQGMCALLRLLTSPDDGVIVQPPTYVLYDRILSRTGRRRADNPLLREGDHYRMDFDGLEALMRGGCRVMLLCNPHNPIMDVWDAETLRRVASLAARYGVTVVSDEIFAEQTFHGKTATPYLEASGGQGVVCTSLGKAFNFTGASHANFLIADAALREGFIRQRNADHYGSLSPFLYTAVTAAYTKEGGAWLDALLAHTAERETRIRARLAETLPWLTVCRHGAGTLLWLDLTASGLSDTEIAARFARARVEVDAGAQYGAGGEGFVRMQFGMPDAELFPALERVIAAFRA